VGVTSRALVRAAVLRAVVVRAIVGGNVCACGPTHVGLGGSRWICCREARRNVIYLFLKIVFVMGLLTSMNPLLLCYTTAMGQPRLLLLCDHNSDGIAVAGRLVVASFGGLECATTMPYRSSVP
jgi:hypothetical protein